MKLSTKTPKRPQTRRVPGKPRTPRGPDSPHDLNVTGLTEREVEKLTAIAKRRAANAQPPGASYSRNALIVDELRALIAREEGGA